LEKKCFKCKDKKDLTIDHHYPLSQGFGLSISNAVPLCRKCNSKKGIKDPVDFYTEDEFLLAEEKLYAAVQEVNSILSKYIEEGYMYEWRGLKCISKKKVEKLGEMT
jgi:CRISPR/Cas system Type II protein with McrA/HNH and RuvC-like nuclease domain